MTYLNKAPVIDYTAILDREHLVRLESRHPWQQQLTRCLIDIQRLRLLQKRESPDRILEEQKLRPGEDDAPALPLPADLPPAFTCVVFLSASPNNCMRTFSGQ